MSKHPDGVVIPLTSVSADHTQVMSRVAHIHQLNDRHKRVVVDMILEFPGDRQLYVSVLITDSDVSKTLPHIERRLQVELRSDGIHATHIDLDGATLVPIQSID